MSTLRKAEQLQAIEATCDQFNRMIASGSDKVDAVTHLADMYGVLRPAIWKRLRCGGALPPYRTNTGIRRLRRSRSEPPVEKNDQPRVNRDPCPRCGCRGDIPCSHSRVRLGMVL